MKRTAYIARTANDLAHVNRLGIPFFGLVELRLAAGAKTSKSYLPDDAPAPTAAETGSDDFHFIPEKETIEIRYEIEDRAGLVSGAKLELFTRFDENAIWTLDFGKLGDDWWDHGKHVIKWDGRIVTPTAEQKGTDKDGGFEHDLTKLTPDKTVKGFPDGFATLEFPPYKFRLTLVSKDWAAFGNPLWAWTYWQILIKRIVLDLGPEEAIPAATVNDAEHQRNKAVRTKLDTDGKVPAEGSTRTVKLISNIFKTNGAEMGTNSAFSEYRGMWGDGAQIPIVAKIRLEDSAGNEVKLDESDKGAVALGETKFLWDWEDPDELVSTQAPGAKPRAFINDAIKYDKDATDESPKGDNCHFDRGGKRGVGAKVIFPEQAGYDAKDTLDAGKFPFMVEKAKKRQWAALSTAWRKGKLKGQTGVVFQPSRMGGDDYVLTVYLANDKSKKDELALNVKTEPLVAANDIKRKSGKFQIWRELHLSKYVRKKNTIADFVAANLGGIRGNYHQAYIEIEDKTVKSELPTAGYDALAKAQITAAADEVVNRACDPAADHSTTASTFLVRDFNAFQAAVRAKLATDNPALSPAQLDTARDNWLATKQVQTAVKYSNNLDAVLRMPAKTLTGNLNTLNGAADGITIVHFDYVCSIRRALEGTAGLGQINGSAIDVAGATRNKCCFVLFKSAVDTFVHEVGHHLFLAHFGPKPDDFDAVFHDSTDLACIMTYNRPRPDFCGYCMIRLRGWNGSKLDPDPTKNHHP